MLYLLILLILLFILFIKPKGNVFFKSLVFGLLFGIIAYKFVPHSDYDLFRHHIFIKYFIKYNDLYYLLLRIKSHEYELLPTVYSFFIAKTNNINLAQFFVVTLGYGTMYYLVADYAKKVNIKNIYYVVIMLFTIFGFYVLYFISGLYFYIGIILFSLAVYLDYQKKCNKILVYLLYFCTLFIHDTMYFPLGLLILYKLFRNKNSIFLILSISILIYFSYSILEYLSSQNIAGFLSPIVKMYNAYLNNGDYMQRLYSGNIFIIEISKLITVLVVTIFTYMRNKKNKFYNFIFLVVFSTLLMMSKSIVMIRFCMLIQLLGIIPLVDYFNNSKNQKGKLIMLLYLVCLCIYYFMYFIYIIHNQIFSF